MQQIRFFEYDDGRYGWYVVDLSLESMVFRGEFLFDTKAEVLEHIKTLKTDFLHATVKDEKTPRKFSQFYRGQ